MKLDLKLKLKAPIEAELSKNKADTQYSKEDLKNVLDKLYRCRDLEISNLWQRSVFLSVFLILCFTAYGYLGFAILDDKDYIRYHIAAICLACVSCIFSIIWVLMAKASKAWYEVYENAITKFENKHYNILGLPEENIMGNMLFPAHQRNDNIRSSNGGAYSPSKINVGIGQISVTIWTIIIVMHIGAIYTNNKDMNTNVSFFIALLIVSITVIAAQIVVFTGFLKSNFLNKNE